MKLGKESIDRLEVFERKEKAQLLGLFSRKWFGVFFWGNLLLGRNGGRKCRFLLVLDRRRGGEKEGRGRCQNFGWETSLGKQNNQQTWRREVPGNRSGRQRRAQEKAGEDFSEYFWWCPVCGKKKFRLVKNLKGRREEHTQIQQIARWHCQKMAWFRQRRAPKPEEHSLAMDKKIDQRKAQTSTC